MKKKIVLENESDFDREKIKAMMEEATLSLLGQPVKIHIRVPRREGTAGEVIKKTDGIAIVLHPNLGLEFFYMDWLHEVGHIYLGHAKEQEPIDYSEMSAALLALIEKGNFLPAMTDDETKVYKDSQEEKDADAFALDMDHVARNKAFERFHIFNAGVEAKIKILMTMYLIPDDRSSKGE
jgi:hypothetical protein